MCDLDKGVSDRIGYGNAAMCQHFVNVCGASYSTTRYFSASAILYVENLCTELLLRIAREKLHGVLVHAFPNLLFPSGSP